MLFLDTSALLKRYLDEDGTPLVLQRMDEDRDWVVSEVAQTEASIAFCRLGLDPEVLGGLRERLREDVDHSFVVPVDAACLHDAAQIGCSQQIRTLDAIHLAAARRLPRPLTFLTFDQRQAGAAAAMGFEIVPVREGG